jgi:hypothetical protein
LRVNSTRRNTDPTGGAAVSTIIQDEVFERLTTFLTREALRQIAEVTQANVSAFESGTLGAENVVKLNS